MVLPRPFLIHHLIQKPFKLSSESYFTFRECGAQNVRYAIQRLSIKASRPTTHDHNQATMECIDVYTDAGEEELEEKATTGILVMAGGSPIGWTARKQDVTTLLSTEAEYITLGPGAQDALWIRKLLEFLGIRRVFRPLVKVRVI